MYADYITANNRSDCLVSAIFKIVVFACVSNRIVRFPWQMSEGKVRRIFQEAFGVWSAVTPLTFREVTTDKADIVIDFSR